MEVRFGRSSRLLSNQTRLLQTKSLVPHVKTLQLGHTSTVSFFQLAVQYFIERKVAVVQLCDSFFRGKSKTCQLMPTLLCSAPGVGLCTPVYLYSLCSVCCVHINFLSPLNVLFFCCFFKWEKPEMRALCVRTAALDHFGLYVPTHQKHVIVKRKNPGLN